MNKNNIRIPQTQYHSALVLPIINADYFPLLVSLFEAASLSINIIIFAARYYRGQAKNPINDFFHSLRRAASRGVKVRLLLNANFQTKESLRYNQFIIRYFKQSNFHAALGGNSTRLHSKLVIIDNQIAIVGSHNYSRRASRVNFETSAVIKSPEVCHLFNIHFERLWKNRTLVPGKVERKN